MHKPSMCPIGAGAPPPPLSPRLPGFGTKHPCGRRFWLDGRLQQPRAPAVPSAMATETQPHLRLSLRHAQQASSPAAYSVSPMPGGAGQDGGVPEPPHGLRNVIVLGLAFTFIFSGAVHRQGALTRPECCCVAWEGGCTGFGSCMSLSSFSSTCVFAFPPTTPTFSESPTTGSLPAQCIC